MESILKEIIAELKLIRKILDKELVCKHESNYYEESTKIAICTKCGFKRILKFKE